MSKKDKHSKSKKSKAKEFQQTLRENILQLLESRPGKGLTVAQILKKLTLKKRDDIKQATLIIYGLENDNLIREQSNGSFVSARELEAFTGIVDHVNSRFAY